MTAYRPRIIRRPGEEIAYLMTCKKESALSLVRWLNDQGIHAAQSGVDVTEQMETDEGTEEYAVSEIALNPPTDYAKVKAAVETWPGAEDE